MPSLSIYLDKEFYEKVKEDPSKIIQNALKFYFENKKKEEKNDKRKNKRNF